MKDHPVAIVTGGATGIGAACVCALAENGFTVGIHYRKSESKAQSLLSDIRGGFLLQADLSDMEQVEAMIDRIKTEAGRVDVLVNNAGLSINCDIHGMRIEQFDEQRFIMRGIWYLTKRILRLFMLRSGSGRIVNISSVVGHTGNGGQIPYTMEKAALDSVAPGFIDTEMTAVLPEVMKDQIISNVPLGRMGCPEEVAEVVAFLATRGSYINGSIIHVNGGLYGG